MTMRIASFPGQSRNPYFELFYRALDEHEIQFCGPLSPTASDADTHADIYHFHWPESIWRSELRGRRERLQRVLSFRTWLRKARKRGKRIVWTAHNAVPHENANWIDRLGCLFLAQNSDLILTHGASAKKQIQRSYLVPNSRFCIIEHGCYDGWYPEAAPKSSTFQRLGLDSSRPMIAMIGQMRPYKGIELAIEAVARLNGPQLLLAGQATESVNLEDLPDCVHVVNRHITEQEVADFMAASDLALFPYRKITGSGALMLAITFERPFVAADLPYFREAHRRAPSAGALFRTGDADACAQAIETMLARPASQSAEQLSKLHSSLNWNSAVLPFVRRLAGL